MLMCCDCETSLVMLVVIMILKVTATFQVIVSHSSLGTSLYCGDQQWCHWRLAQYFDFEVTIGSIGVSGQYPAYGIRLHARTTKTVYGICLLYDRELSTKVSL